MLNDTGSLTRVAADLVSPATLQASCSVTADCHCLCLLAAPRTRRGPAIACSECHSLYHSCWLQGVCTMQSAGL